MNLKTVLIKSVLCLFAGALASFGMAPHNMWFILLPCLGVLYAVLMSATTIKRAGIYGLLFGYGYFAFGLSWVGNALLVENNPYQWVYPFAVMGAPVLLSWVIGLAAMTFRLIASPHTLLTPFVFASIFTLLEWFRGTFVFAGFPWNSFGYTWGDTLQIAQIVSINNIYLLTFLTLFWGGALGFVYLKKQRLLRVSMAALLIVTFAVVYAFGNHRMASTDIEYDTSVTFKIVQPNINQANKWAPDLFETNFYKRLNLSRSSATPQSLEEISDQEKQAQRSASSVTYIVWPETALTSIHMKNETFRLQLKNMLQRYPGKAYLITGYLRTYRQSGSAFNSMIMLDKNLEIVHIYDKHHLVPFGEYIPFQSLIPVKTITQFSGFVAGEGPQTLATPEGYSIAPLICYESIFPGRLFNPQAPFPDILLNIANDAWYGDSAGPHQHFEQAKFRAIETGIPLIRSTGTGISGAIDPLGHIVRKTSLFKAEALSFHPPVKTSPPLLHYALLKEQLFKIICFAFILTNSFFKRKS